MVDNRPGASGQIGTVAAAQAAPDGYTLLWAAGSLFGTDPFRRRFPPQLAFTATRIRPNTLLMPVIDDGGVHHFTLVVKAHQADIGNSIPYHGTARDVYEEGALIFPAVKVASDLSRQRGLCADVPAPLVAGHTVSLAIAGVGRLGRGCLSRKRAEAVRPVRTDR